MRYSRLGYWGLPALAVAILAIGVFVVLRVMPPGMLWLKAGIYSTVLVVCTSLCLATYRFADEVQMQTQKSAWFWGSICAAIAVTPLMIIIAWRLIPFPVSVPHPHPGVYFVLGMLFMWVAEGIGFAVAQAWQWWQLR